MSALARVRVPKNFNHRSPHARRDLAATLRNARVENDLGARKVKHRSAAADDPVLDDLRRALRAHPVHGLPDREERVRVAERWLRAVREADALQHKMTERTGSLTRQFDATCDVLEELGYLVPEVAPLVPADTEVLGAGRRRARWSPTTAGGSRGSGPRPTCWSPSACAPGPGAGSPPAELAAVASTAGLRGPAGQPGAARRARREGRRRPIAEMRRIRLAAARRRGRPRRPR